jgi:hypothetical protein
MATRLSIFIAVVVALYANADDGAQTPGGIVGRVVWGARDAIVQKIAAISGEKADKYYNVLTDEVIAKLIFPLIFFSALVDPSA